MGIIGNASVYGLMVLPLAMLIRGRCISVSRLFLLMVVMTALQFAESILRASAAGLENARLALLVVDGLVIPVMEAHFFLFILTDARATKAFRLQEAVSEADEEQKGKYARGAGGDIAAAAAVAWCLCHLLFFRVGDWYRTMSSLGFEEANLLAGVEAFAQLLLTLTLCRVSASCKQTSAAFMSAAYVGLMACAVSLDSTLSLAPYTRLGLGLASYTLCPLLVHAVSESS